MAHALLLTTRGAQGSRQTSVVLGLRVAAVVLALVVAVASGVGAANVAVGADGDAAPDVPLGLRLRSENGRFFVTQSATSDVTPGEALIGVGPELLSTKTFAEALQAGESPFVLPMVAFAEDGLDNGYPLAGFIRVEMFQPSALSFERPGTGGRHEIKLRDDPPAPPPAPAPAPASTPNGVGQRGLIDNFDASQGEAEGTTYEAVFRVPGPLGLELITNEQAEMTVKSVAPHAHADNAGVMAGDVLLSVNGEPFVKGWTMQQAIQLLGKASFPKKVELRMSAEHLNVQDAKERIALRAAQREARAAAHAKAMDAARAAKPPPPPPPPPPPRPPVHEPIKVPKDHPVKPGTPPPKSRADRRAEAAAAMAAAVAAIPDDEYEAMYTGGSMGIEFDATMPGLVVSAVIKSGASDKSGVKPGDRVVKVNGEELGDKDFREGVQVIMKAEWPKTLQFKRAEVVETKDPSEEGGGIIELTKPDTVAGVRVSLKSALFGHPLPSCTHTVTFVRAEPLLGCGEQRLLSNRTRAEREEDPQEGDSMPYLVALRGGCTFPDKAVRATAANADGLIVVSTKAAVVRMPGDPSVRTDVAAAMVNQEEGMMLAGASGVGPVQGIFLMEDVEGCKFDGTEVIPVLSKPDNKMEADNGGRLLVWNGTVEESFGYVTAMFGPEADPGVVAPIVRARPFSGCLMEGEGFANVLELSHSFALVERGVCAFSDKVRNLQKINVRGVIVVNTDDRLMPMPAAPPFDDIVTTAAMIAPGFLRAPLIQPPPEPRDAPPPPLLGRLVPHSAREAD